MLRRVLTRLTAALLFCVFFSLSAFAQGGYGGGGTGGTGTGTYTPPSGGFKKNTRNVIRAGGAAPAARAFFALRQPPPFGCVLASPPRVEPMNGEKHKNYT